MAANPRMSVMTLFELDLSEKFSRYISPIKKASIRFTIIAPNMRSAYFELIVEYAFRYEHMSNKTRRNEDTERSNPIGYWFFIRKRACSGTLNHLRNQVRKIVIRGKKIYFDN